MTATDIPQAGGDLPQGAESPTDSRWPNWLKGTILLVLLACLGLALLMVVQCFRTGNPTNVPGVDNVLGSDTDPPPFEQSLLGVGRPWGVAVGLDGEVYVTDTAGEREIHVFDQGVEIASFAPPDTYSLARSLMYLAVSPSGELYVSDRDGAAIHIFSADGTPLGRVGPPAELGGEWHPLGMAFDASGDLYVTDVTPGKHRLLVLDQVGELKLEIGKEGTGDGDFSYPNGVAIGEDGRIYVSDSNNGRVQVFDSTGEFLYKIGRGLASADLSLPRGIAIDGDRLYVVDTTRHLVQVYRLGEEPELLHVISGQDENGLLYPDGLALDGHGGVYVADSENNRVQVWRY